MIFEDLAVDFSGGRDYNSSNTKMRRVGCETCQREAYLLEVPSWEAFENYLGVTPIRSGGHRYRQNEAGCRMASKRVEPRDFYRLVPSYTEREKGRDFIIL